jgi:ribonuclease E
MPAPVAFELPTDALHSIAQGAGLQWVNSDTEKMRAAQAAMAAEPQPQPVRVPRAPKPVTAVDDGPLVLVETRKDLSQVKLPFEQGSTPPTV